MTSAPWESYDLSAWAKLGEHVRQARKSLNLTSKQLAERVGVSRAVISRLENGKVLTDSSAVGEARDYVRPQVVFSRLKSLGEALGLGPDWAICILQGYRADSLMWESIPNEVPETDTRREKATEQTGNRVLHLSDVTAGFPGVPMEDVSLPEEIFIKPGDLKEQQVEEDLRIIGSARNDKLLTGYRDSITFLSHLEDNGADVEDVIEARNALDKVFCQAIRTS